MSELVLVDTSSWTHSLRERGDPSICDRIRFLLTDDRAAWCDPVRLELWAGVRARERARLSELDRDLHRLPITDRVWSLACRLADVSRDAGITAPPNDFLIYACARSYGVALEHADQHFDHIEKLADAVLADDA